jgi:2-desacetyl-2-hydroxyethyl bacteriochlorophyllide A dehydrogenase
MSNRVPPLIMGHEFSGVVAEADDPTQLGSRVAVNPLISCWQCEMCRAGNPHLCPTRKIIGIHVAGAFAGFVVAPEINLVELPAGLSFEGGALVEPLAVVVHAVDFALRGGIPESALVIGAGTLGLLTTRLLAGVGVSRLVVTDLTVARLELAQTLGATRTINGRDRASADPMPTDFEVVFDCVGSGLTKIEAVRSVRSGGTVVLLGLHDETLPINAQELVRREIALRGAVTYTPRDFRRAVQILASDAVPYEDWIERRPLARGAESFEELLSASGKVVKVLLGDGS